MRRNKNRVSLVIALYPRNFIHWRCG